ncbi:MAG: SRPBCC family protein [Candidatus Dormibacteraceae bacterium]
MGAGTVISVKLPVQGGARTLRMTVSEPEPGRVLEEYDQASNTVTRFTVEAADGGSNVRIDTRFPRSGGPRGVVEAIVAPPMLRRRYRKELSLLATYACDNSA